VVVKKSLYFESDIYVTQVTHTCHLTGSSYRHALLGFFQQGFFVFKNIFQKHAWIFGSFENLFVLLTKGENTTRLCGRERG